MQGELMAERAARRRSTDPEEGTDKSKEPAKLQNGKSAGRGGKAAEARLEGGETPSSSTR
jgi:hypothetical protein